MAKKTTEQVTPPELRNPTGKGGFAENPQNRSDGGWKKEDSVGYNINKLMRMSEEEFEAYGIEGKLTVAQRIAWERLNKARQILAEAVFVTDRTEGRPKESVEFSGEINNREQKPPTKAEWAATLAYQKEYEKHNEDY